MYRIVKRTAVVVKGKKKSDVEWKTQVYGEFFAKAVAEQALEEMDIPKYNVEIERYHSFEERINTDYLD